MAKPTEKKVRGGSKMAARLTAPRKLSPLEYLEREREFLSQELHDTISQSLSGLTIMITFLQGRVEKGQALTAAEVEELKQQIHKATDDLKIFSFLLKPENLSGGGLILALSELVDFTSQFHPCQFESRKPVFISSSEKAFGLFRIVQETLRCAASTSSKKKIKIKLSQIDDEVVLEISPFVPKAVGREYIPALIELHCENIGGKAVFNSQDQKIVCRVKNM